MLDALPLGAIGGQHAPLDAALGHLEDGIEPSPHTPGAGSATTFGGWDHIFDPLPLLVGQVAWVSFSIHSPILHNSRRLFRQTLRREKKESSTETRCLRSLIMLSNVWACGRPATPPTARGRFSDIRPCAATCLLLEKNFRLYLTYLCYDTATPRGRNHSIHSRVAGHRIVRLPLRRRVESACP